ncbi:MAG: LLM class flavin-dependent oxidoreductase [Halobacteria archaeon]|nr:LLM class flavin-dependent oxidoreductase [Halobacteria archaeon]
MKIGTGLFTCQKRPDDGRSMSEIYDEMIEIGKAVDRAGLDSAWVSEHHFTDDGYLPGTMPSLSALGSVTSEIEIGTCIALAPLYDAVRLAEDGATVDLVSNGRLTLGMSIGYRDLEFEEFGIPKEERVDRTVEAVNLLKGAWTPGPIDYQTEFHSISPDTSVTPKPSQDPHPPIVLSGGAKPAVRRAARIANGWVAPSSISIEGVRKRTEDIEKVREKEDIEGDFQVYVIQHGFVGESREDAWEKMKSGYLYIQRKYAEWYAGESIEELPDERVEELRDQAIFGTPEQVIEGLEEYRDALGGDIHFILRTYHPGVGTETMVECIERLGEEVAPHFR